MFFNGFHAVICADINVLYPIWATIMDIKEEAEGQNKKCPARFCAKAQLE
jgi:hypothetical protein